MVRQQDQRLQQQVVKIKRVKLFHPLFIFCHDIMNHGIPPVAKRSGEPFVRCHHFVFGIADFCPDLPYRQETVVNIELFQNFLQDTLLIVIIKNGERPAVSDFLDITAENACTRGMKRADPGFLSFFGTDQALHP